MELVKEDILPSRSKPSPYGNPVTQLASAENFSAARSVFSALRFHCFTPECAA